MRSLFFVCTSLVLMVPTNIRSQDLPKDQQARFLRIELESYYKAYANACDNLRDLEQQIAISTDESVRGEELAKRRENLETHLSNLKKRANATRQSLIGLAKTDERPHTDQNLITRKFFLQNHLEQTARGLDVGIDGDGYFRAFDLRAEQVVFTRVGSFDTDKDGHLILDVASRKLRIRPAIQVPEDAVNLVVKDDGSVLVRLAGRAVPR